MTVNNAINSPFPTTLAKGGTNAALTASNGGIFYSTASAEAILAGTATANQILLSGSSTTPAWSTATYPATTTINQLLYSSAANVIGGLSTANSASLVTNSSGVPAWSGSMTNGQVIIGSTGGTPTAATLTAGTHVVITNSSGNITVSSGLGGNWVWISTQTASSSGALNFNSQFSSTYVAYRLVLVNLLPATNVVDLQLRLGTGAGPTYISSGYLNQLLSVSNNGSSLSYTGYAGGTANRALIAQNVSSSSTFGGICGTIDLFVTAGSSNVANGVSQVSYASNTGVTRYSNSRATFQQPAASFTSVRLLPSSGLLSSGSVYLYGLTAS